MQPIPPHPYPLKPLSAWGILGRSLELFIDNSLLLMGIVMTYTVPHAFLSLLGRWAAGAPEETGGGEIVRIAFRPEDFEQKVETFRQLFQNPFWVSFPQTCLEWIWQPIALGAVFIALDREIRGQPCSVGEALGATKGKKSSLFAANLIVMLLIYAAGIAGFIAAFLLGLAAALFMGISVDSLPEFFLTLLMLLPLLGAICLGPPVMVFLRTVFSLCSAAVEERGATDAIGRSWTLFRRPVEPGFWHSHDWRMTVVLTVAGIVTIVAGLAAAVPRAVDLLVRGGTLLNDGLGGLGLSPLPPVHLPPASPYLFFVIESVFSAVALLSIAVPVFVYFTDFRIRLEGYPAAPASPEPLPPAAGETASPLPGPKHYLD